MNAAKIVAKLIKRGENVIIATGFPVLPHGIPETDGPPGAIAMARFFQSVGMNVFLLTESHTAKLLRVLSQKFLGGKAKVIEILPYENFTEKLIDEIEPAIAIAIEKPGMTEDGKFYDMNGNDISRFVGKVDNLFTRVKSIGIGDGGNEIGMGNVFHAAPNKKIASITRTDALIVGGVSNWAAYGMIACLSILLGKNFCHDGRIEKSLIKSCVDAGAIDGITKRREYSVDALPLSIHESIVELLFNIVEALLNHV